MPVNIPTCSVVVPLFNKERYVARAVQSVLNQTCPDFELIVVDDGSTDVGAKVVESFTDPRIRLIRQANAGVSAARNRGIAEARADLIAFLDADDEWFPEHLATLLGLVGKYPQCGAYATAKYLVSGEAREEVRPKGIPSGPWDGVVNDYFAVALDHQPINSSVALVPRRTFDVCGTFPVGEPLHEDLDMWCRIALRFLLAYSTRVTASCYRDADNMAVASPNCSNGRIIDTLESALHDNGLPKWVNKKALRDYKDRWSIDIAARHLQLGSARYARHLLRGVDRTGSYAEVASKLWLWSWVPPGLTSTAGRCTRLVGDRCSHFLGKSMVAVDSILRTTPSGRGHTRGHRGDER